MKEIMQKQGTVKAELALNKSVEESKDAASGELNYFAEMERQRKL